MKKHIIFALAFVFSAVLMQAADANAQGSAIIETKLAEYRALPRVSSTQKIWRQQNAEVLAMAVSAINESTKQEDAKLLVELHLRNANADAGTLEWPVGKELAKQYSQSFYISYFASAEEVAAAPVDRNLAASMAIAATRLGGSVDLNVYFEQLTGQGCNHRAYRTWFLDKVRTAGTAQQRRELLSAELKALVFLPANSDRDAWMSQLQKMFSVYKDL